MECRVKTFSSQIRSHQSIGRAFSTGIAPVKFFTNSACVGFGAKNKVTASSEFVAQCPHFALTASIANRQSPTPGAWRTVIVHGEFFSTLENWIPLKMVVILCRLGTAADGGDLVLFYPEIHACGLSAGAAGAVFA